MSDMLDQIKHRGPDDSGIWEERDSGIIMGHRRLAILDLSEAGHQPMASSSGRFIMVYNGECYNYREIAAEIAPANHRWRGNSDTEVLLEAFEKWGVQKTLQHVNGMLAMALWDIKEKCLYLARDKIGKKPLYYGFNGRTFYFGSELKAIRRHPEFQAEINRDAISLLMRYSYIPAPHCIFKGLRKLAPGSFLRIFRKDIANQSLPVCRKYWSMEDIAMAGIKDPFTGTEEEILCELKPVLANAVKRRMISDVPLGAFLSGGIDSSIIVGLMQELSSIPIRTFTIGFLENSHNEAADAKAVANFYGTDHTELYLTQKDAMDVVSDLPNLFDEPYADPSQIPMFLLSRMSRQYVTVALSGDGGDEMFAGYNRHFWGRNLWEKISGKPPILKKGLSFILRNISQGGSEHMILFIMNLMPKFARQRNIIKKIEKFAVSLESGDRLDFYNNLVSTWKHPGDIVIGSAELETFSADRGRWSHWNDFTQLMMLIDMNTYLPDDIMTKVDRASMAVSLEARAPFLDPEVAEFAWRIPVSMNISKIGGKMMLKRLLGKMIPKKLYDRPKMGFGIPVEKWLRNDLRDWGEELLSPTRLKNAGFLDAEYIRKMWEEHQSGRKNRDQHLWNVLTFQAWEKNLQSTLK